MELKNTMEIAMKQSDMEYEMLERWEAEAETRIHTDHENYVAGDVDTDLDIESNDGWTDEEIRRQAWWDSAKPSIRSAFQARQLLVSALRRFAYEDAVAAGRNPEEILAERLGIDPDHWQGGLDLAAEIDPDMGREDHTDILPFDWDSKESPRFQQFQTWVETCVRRRGVYPAKSRTRDMEEKGYGEIPERQRRRSDTMYYIDDGDIDTGLAADPTRRDSEHELMDLDAYGAIPEKSGSWFWSQPQSVASWPHKRTIADIKNIEQFVGAPIRRALRSEVRSLLQERQGVLDFQVIQRNESKYRQQAIDAVAQVRSAWELAWDHDPVEAFQGSKALSKLRRIYLGRHSNIRLWQRVDQKSRIPQTKDHQGQWINRPELALHTRIIKAIWRKAHNKIRTPIGIAWVRNTALSTDLRETMIKAIPASYRGPRRWAVQVYFDCIASGHATL